jgi:hypothetical protein
MDNNLIHYTRSFKKIFLIISDVFPILRFVLYFIKKFTKHIKMSLTKRKLTCLIFENRQKKPMRIFYRNMNRLNKNVNNVKNKGTVFNKSEQRLIQDKTIKNKIINLEDSNINNINRYNKNNFNIENDVENNQNETIYRIKKEDLNSKISLKSNILSNKINNSMNEEDINKNFKIKQMSLTNSRNKFKSLYNYLEIKDSFKSSSTRKNQKYIFPYYYFFFEFFYDKVISPKKYFCIPKTYFAIYNFMCQIYDISTHIIIFRNFNLLNNALKAKLTEENINFPSRLFNNTNYSENKLTKN